MNYDNVYSKSRNAWGNEPSELIKLTVSEIPQKSNILDLGSA